MLKSAVRRASGTSDLSDKLVFAAKRAALREELRREAESKQASEAESKHVLEQAALARQATADKVQLYKQRRQEEKKAAVKVQAIYRGHADRGRLETLVPEGSIDGGAAGKQALQELEQDLDAEAAAAEAAAIAELQELEAQAEELEALEAEAVVAERATIAGLVEEEAEEEEELAQQPPAATPVAPPAPPEPPPPPPAQPPPRPAPRTSAATSTATPLSASAPANGSVMLELRELRELFAASPATARAPLGPACRMSYGEIEAAVLARRKHQPPPAPDFGVDMVAVVTGAAGEAASSILAGAQATAEKLAKLGAASPPDKGKLRTAGANGRGVRRAADGRRGAPATPLHALMPEYMQSSEALMLACCAQRRSPDGRGHREVPEAHPGQGGPAQHQNPYHQHRKQPPPHRSVIVVTPRGTKSTRGAPAPAAQPAGSDPRPAK